MAEPGSTELDLLFSTPRSGSSRDISRQPTRTKGSSLPLQSRNARNARPSQEESVHHAIEQVHAIMDLYSLTQISSDMITTTLDGVIQTVFREKTHMTSRKNKEDSSILDELEGLVWRLGELNIPLDSIMALKAMLSMQRHKYETETLESKRAYIDRAAKLLLYYCQGGRQEVDQRIPRSFRWPREDTRGVLQFAKSNQVGMTPHLWDLFQHLRIHDPEEKFVREVTSDTLHILADSEETWIAQSHAILIGLEDRYRVTNNTLYLARDDELELALSTASTLGHAQQATWLFRRLYNKHRSPSDRKQLWCRLMTAYAQSHSEGSLSYMERLVRSQEEMHHRDIFNIVLKRISKERTPGTGLRAENFFNEMLLLSSKPNKAASLHPNMESLSYCTTAYLDEKPRVLENVVNADALVRRFFSTYNVTKYHHDGDSIPNGRVFERLLEAYASCAPKDPKAIQAAEDLFRFFLLQHRDGNTTERPCAKHLDYMLQLLSQQPNKRNAETSLEFFRILEKLAKADGLDTTNTCTNNNLNMLMESLSKSGQKDLVNAMEGR